MKKFKDESFISICPFNKNLKNYIAYYYFHECKAADFNRTYIYYPHVRNTLTIYQNQSVHITEDLCIYTPTKDSISTVFYSRNLKKQIKVIQNGPLYKIGVVFNPLGINHFIAEKLSSISEKVYSPFTYYKGELAMLCKEIYMEESILKVKALDLFFESKLISFRNDRLHNCLDLIHQHKTKIKVSEMADELNVNRKTLYREFRDHLCSSIDEYKATLRFRLALDYYHRFNNPLLTDVVYDNNFYDQPDFTNHFKKMTGSGPRMFFKNLSKLSNNDVYWTLLT